MLYYLVVPGKCLILVCFQIPSDRTNFAHIQCLLVRSNSALENINNICFHDNEDCDHSFSRNYLVHIQFFKTTNLSFIPLIRRKKKIQLHEKIVSWRLHLYQKLILFQQKKKIVFLNFNMEENKKVTTKDQIRGV